MKKLLQLIGALALTSVTGSSIIACGTTQDISIEKKLTKETFKEVIESTEITFNIKTGLTQYKALEVQRDQLKEIFKDNYISLPSNFGITFDDNVNQFQLNQGIIGWQSKSLSGKGESHIILTSGLSEEVKVNAKYIINVTCDPKGV